MRYFLSLTLYRMRADIPLRICHSFKAVRQTARQLPLPPKAKQIDWMHLTPFAGDSLRWIA